MINKDIKFRYTFKRKDDGHLWQFIASLNYIEESHEDFIEMLDNDLWELIARDQFTTLTDHDGISIYENNILASCSNKKEKYLVVWGDWCWKLKRGDITLELIGWNNYVSIGDIHLNPELLESK